MTRKDYELIASRFAQIAATALSDGQDAVLTDLALGLAEDFQKANPNFQPARFLAACGVTV